MLKVGLAEQLFQHVLFANGVGAGELSDGGRHRYGFVLAGRPSELVVSAVDRHTEIPAAPHD